MGRTTREEHSRICEQCKAMERELERLRAVLNDAEDQVKQLEVKMFPGRTRMLKNAAEREADARAAYSEAQHRLDDIKRQERLLRMKMRREESDISVDDIPEVSTIGEVSGIVDDADVEDIPDVDVEDIPEANIDHVVIDDDEAAVEEPPKAVAEERKREEVKREAQRHCEENHVYEERSESGWFRYEEQSSRERAEELGEDIKYELAEQGKKLWGQAKKAWRVLNKMDVPEDESLRLEIMTEIYEIEGVLRAVRDSIGTVKVLGALKATNELANLKPKIVRLSNLVDTARMECPQIYFPEITMLDADGFSLMEDVLAKKGTENQSSTVLEIDQFLILLSKLKAAVHKMPERAGVVDRL